MPLPERYAKEIAEMTRIWSPEGYFEAQSSIWDAQAEARHEKYGEPNAEQLAQIKSALILNPEDYDHLNQAKGHETNRLLRLVQGRAGDGARFIHLYNTSADVLDTALAIQFRNSLDLLSQDFGELSKSLRALALRYMMTKKIGRSHGQHGIIVTLGHQIARYLAEVDRGIDRFERAKEVISYGKLSGEMGTHAQANSDPEIEEMALAKLSLKPDPAPSQVISRDRHAEVLGLMAVNSGTLAKIAIDVRSQSRTEIGELREPFEAGEQEGSSSMPHKRNPELCERVVGLNRRIRSTASEELDAMLLWDERDISHSSTERFSFPDAFGGLAYSTKLISAVINGLEVDTERMKSNIDLTHGAIYSSSLMNALIDAGMDRTSAYESVKKMALNAMDERIGMEDLALKDPKIRKILSVEQLGNIFDPQTYLRNIDVPFKRLGLL